MSLDNNIIISAISPGSILKFRFAKINSRSSVEKKSGGREDYKNNAQCMDDSLVVQQLQKR